MAIDVLEQTTSRRVAAVVFLRSIVTQEEITWQKKRSPFALHMSAFDPKRTCEFCVRL